MPTLVTAEGTVLARVLDALPPDARDDLSATAFARLERALQQTAWATAHRRRVALLDGDTVLATAVVGRLAARLDGHSARVCAIGSLWADPAHGAEAHAAAVIAGVVDAGRADGADVAVLAGAGDGEWRIPEGFEPIPTGAVEVQVIESTRYGAPMTMVRGGEDRDLAAIVAMGEARARDSRFHLVRDVEYVKFAVTRRRLLAGLAAAGQRELRFLIAEEGITAAAYVVLTATPGRWTIEECGDRDPSGARVGALLQAAIAREPVEQRPSIGGWLPPGFAPPQLAIVPAAAPPIVAARSLSAQRPLLGLAAADVHWWRTDLL